MIRFVALIVILTLGACEGTEGVVPELTVEASSLRTHSFKPNARTLDQAEKEELRSVLATYRDGHFLRGGLQPKFVQARYSFAELKEWRDRIRFDGWVTGMMALDIDETRNRIVVGTIDAATETSAAAEFAELGIPEGAVRYQRASAVTTLKGLSDEFDPTTAGVAITSAAGNKCNIGFNGFTSNGVCGFITNSHCTAENELDDMGTVTGMQIRQPEFEQGNRIVGDEFLDPPFLTSTSSCGGSVNPGGCRWSDAAFVSYDAEDDHQQGTIARTKSAGISTGSTEIDPSFARFLITQTGGSFVSVGDTVHKVGRMTGWTKGAITATCVDRANSETNEGHLFFCQNEVAAGSIRGDSGSPVFTWDTLGDEVTPQGILWGGEDGEDLYFYTPYDNIEVDFDEASPFDVTF